MGIANGRLFRLVVPGFVAPFVLAVATGPSAAQSPGPLTPDDLSLDGRTQGPSSPTYAASPQGSPYSAVYSRTFGSSGKAQAVGPAEQASPPAVTKPTAGEGPVVYVIDSSGLLTYRREDYAGGGAALARTPLPSSDASTAGPMAPAEVPSVADNLYRQPPLETAAGPATSNRKPADLGAAKTQ